MKKVITLIMALSLIIGCAIGATIAWLTAKTDEVKNTFTVGNVDVYLDETKEAFKMIPGWTIEKDPYAGVTDTSEDSYLFVEVQESENLDEYIAYAIDEKWTKLEEGVYYIEIDTADEKGVNHPILGAGTYPNTEATDDVEYPWADDEVLVLPTVTKPMMDVLTADTYPTLTFTAYAVQLWQNNETKFSAADAWANIQSSISAGTIATEPPATP